MVYGRRERLQVPADCLFPFDALLTYRAKLIGLIAGAPRTSISGRVLSQHITELDATDQLLVSHNCEQHPVQSGASLSAQDDFAVDAERTNRLLAAVVQ
jgi:hypothetical protein